MCNQNEIEPNKTEYFRFPPIQRNIECALMYHLIDCPICVPLHQIYCLSLSHKTFPIHVFFLFVSTIYHVQPLNMFIILWRRNIEDYIIYIETVQIMNCDQQFYYAATSNQTNKYRQENKNM